MLFGGKIELGAVHTYLELFARYFIDLTPNVALIAAVSADRDGNLYTGPNTEDTPTVVEATSFKDGLVVAQVNEIVDKVPRVDIPGDRVHFVVEGGEALFRRAALHPRSGAITETQILTAMLAIKGIYAPYGVRRLNHGIGFNTAAIELLLPTYGEKLGLKGKVATHFALNPHPTLIPAIESGWVEQIHCFGSEVGMDDYIEARPDIFFTGPDGSLRSNRAFCQTAGLYACDMFIGSTLQIDLDGKLQHRHGLPHRRLRRRAEHGLRCPRPPPPERALAAGRQGGRSRRAGASAARPQAGRADRRDLRRKERAALRRKAGRAGACREAEARAGAGDDLRRRRHPYRHRGRHRQSPALPQQGRARAGDPRRRGLHRRRSRARQESGRSDCGSAA